MPADTALDTAASMLTRAAMRAADGQQREELADQDEERVPRRVRQSEDVRGGDVLARVPHRGGRRQGHDVEAEHEHRRDAGREVRRAVVEVG